MRNTAEIELETNIEFATIDLQQNTAEIALGSNIGFVTIDLHTKYNINRLENEDRVCNHCFTC